MFKYYCKKEAFFINALISYLFFSVTNEMIKCVSMTIGNKRQTLRDRLKIILEHC